MRRSMKRLKTFKHNRRSDGNSSDITSIPLEDIGGKAKKKLIFTVISKTQLKYSLFEF